MSIRRLSEMADQLQAAQCEVERLTEELNSAQKLVKRLSEFDIPELMDDLGVTELKTTSGLTVHVDEKLHAKKLTHAHEQALNWLREHDQGGLIKTVVGVPFSDDDDKANSFLNELSSQGIAAEKLVEVHHSSLAAAIRKMLEAGEDVPLELLGAYQRRVASVKGK